jgi:hypothetical protein
MVYIARQANTFKAGWELVSRGIYQTEIELIFGIVLVGTTIRFPTKLRLRGTLAPFFPISHMPGYLALPSFVQRFDDCTLVLETSDDLFDNIETEREKYIVALASSNPELLAQGINRASFEAYLVWRFPGLRLEADHSRQLDIICESIDRSK